MFNRDVTYTAMDIQKAYNKMYSEFRNYLWDMDTIVMLGDIELEAYNLFIDLDKLKGLLKRMKSQVNGAKSKPDDFKDLLEKIEEFIEVVDKMNEQGNQSIPIFNLVADPDKGQEDTEDENKEEERDRVRRVTRDSDGGAESNRPAEV